MMLVTAGRITGEVAAVLAVSGVVAAWLFLSHTYDTNTVPVPREDLAEYPRALNRAGDQLTVCYQRLRELRQ
jgi:hypothetical protein